MSAALQDDGAAGAAASPVTTAVWPTRTFSRSRFVVGAAVVADGFWASDCAVADAATSAVVLVVSAQHARAAHRARGDGLMSEVLSVG